MSLSPWDAGSDSDQVTGLWDNRLVGHRKILAWQRAKLPRYGREGAVEVRPFTAKKRLIVSEAQGLSGEAMKRNPTTVIPRVDESKSKSSNNRRLDGTRKNYDLVKSRVHISRARAPSLLYKCTRLLAFSLRCRCWLRNVVTFSISMSFRSPVSIRPLLYSARICSILLSSGSKNM